MTAFTDEVRDTVSPYKFSGSRRAAAAWLFSLDGCDEESGDVDSPTGWFGRVGRDIVGSDDRGFVWTTKYANESQARSEYETLNERYSEWLGDDD